MARKLSFVRIYEVQDGDSPAGIAARPDMAGCPKCSIDLIRANPHKLTRTLPNGFVTFTDMRPGERLNLPEKWFNGELDRMPQSYFDSLPYADGVTPAHGLSDQTDDLAKAANGVSTAFAADANYCASVAQAGSAVNTAVHAFKLAWNAAHPDQLVPVGTGNYEKATADALAAQIGSAAPPACPDRAPQPLPVTSVVLPVPAASPVKRGLSTGAVVGIGLAAAVTVGGVTYLVTRKPAKRRR